MVRGMHRLSSVYENVEWWSGEYIGVSYGI